MFVYILNQQDYNEAIETWGKSDLDFKFYKRIKSRPDSIPKLLFV